MFQLAQLEHKMFANDAFYINTFICLPKEQIDAIFK